MNGEDRELGGRQPSIERRMDRRNGSSSEHQKRKNAQRRREGHKEKLEGKKHFMSELIVAPHLRVTLWWGSRNGQTDDMNYVREGEKEEDDDELYMSCLSLSAVVGAWGVCVCVRTKRVQEGERMEREGLLWSRCREKGQESGWM